MKQSGFRSRFAFVHENRKKRKYQNSKIDVIVIADLHGAAGVPAQQCLHTEANARRAGSSGPSVQQHLQPHLTASGKAEGANGRHTAAHCQIKGSSFTHALYSIIFFYFNSLSHITSHRTQDRVRQVAGRKQATTIFSPATYPTHTAADSSKRHRHSGSADGYSVTAGFDDAYFYTHGADENPLFSTSTAYQFFNENGVLQPRFHKTHLSSDAMKNVRHSDNNN